MFRLTAIKKKLAAVLAALMVFTTLAYADSIVTGSKPFTFIPGTTISSSQVNADFDYIINQVNTNAAKNGANSSITSLLGMTTPLAPASGGSATYMGTTVGGTVNAITVTATTPAIAGYTLSNKNLIIFSPSGANTTSPVTLNVNGTGVNNIFKYSNSGLIALQPGDLQLNQPAVVFWDGTNYSLTETPQGFGTKTSLASAATTDLGTIGSHFISVTGTTGITSFGSSANLAQPLYFIRFTSALTVTPGGSLFLPSGVATPFAANDNALVEYNGGGVWTVLQIIRNSSRPNTVQRFTSGTGATYTPGTGVTFIKVRMVGGGAGGGAVVTNSGTNGTGTSFGGWGCGAGVGGGPVAANFGVGGTGGANGTGTLITRIDGQDGSGGSSGNTFGGWGGSSAFGGGAPGRQGSTGTGATAKANTGSGGAGGQQAGTNAGAGGGAGEYVEFYMTAAQIGASQTYTVGGGGAGGVAGTQAGGAGAAGIIIVEEFYN